MKKEASLSPYLLHLLGCRGVSQTFLAEATGHSLNDINRCLRGLNTGENIKYNVAWRLGFSSWDDLMDYIMEQKKIVEAVTDDKGVIKPCYVRDMEKLAVDMALRASVEFLEAYDCYGILETAGLLRLYGGMAQLKELQENILYIKIKDVVRMKKGKPLKQMEMFT